jgi:high affinity cGMP-specific 3',5'-cyclic phosphodiesterase 9
MHIFRRKQTESKKEENSHSGANGTNKETVESLKQQVTLLKHQLAIEQLHHKEQEFALAPSVQPQPIFWELDKWKTFEERKKILETLDFDPCRFQDSELFQLGYDMFQTFDLINHFKIPVSNIKNFLSVLKGSYRKVPFHNFYHAFNVAQSLFFFLTVCKASEKLSKLEIFAAIIAAFCHDIDHPGLNNAFQVNFSTTLAMRYNDVSVLENHHCHQAFNILNLPECNILVNLSPDQYKLIRKYITGSILATDLAEHGNWLNKLKTKIQNMNWEDFEDKKLILCCLIKCADISNEIRPSQIGQSWAQRVMTEFYIQSAIEKAKGMQCAPHMDPEKTDVASGQIGFINFLCLPFFKVVCEVFPLMKVCCDQMETNRAEWEKLKNKK